MRISKIPNHAEQVKVVLNGTLDNDEYDIEQILTSLKLNFRAFNITTMEVLMRAIMDNEVENVAGGRHACTGVQRWTLAPGYVVAGGTKVKIDRPRLRDKATKKEIELSSYKKFQQDEPWCESVLNRMILRSQRSQIRTDGRRVFQELWYFKTHNQSQVDHGSTAKN